MQNITQVCDGIYRNDSDIDGPPTLTHDGVELHRFMNKFYIRCVPDELTAIEVSELCRQRSLYPELIGPANQKVRDIFKRFITCRRPSNLLEIGAGSTPIFSKDDLSAMNISSVMSDADPENSDATFSGFQAKLEYGNGELEMAAALFVLHFHFYDEQISEICRCLATDGILLANIYCRSEPSRRFLESNFNKYGLSVIVIKDPDNLCKDHEYWVVGKNVDSMNSAVDSLKSHLVEKSA